MCIALDHSEQTVNTVMIVFSLQKTIALFKSKSHLRIFTVLNRGFTMSPVYVTMWCCVTPVASWDADFDSKRLASGYMPLHSKWVPGTSPVPRVGQCNCTGLCIRVKEKDVTRKGYAHSLTPFFLFPPTYIGVASY